MRPCEEVHDKEAEMSNADIVQAWIKAYEGHDFDGANDLIADDFVFAGPIPEPIGKPEFAALHRTLVGALPDWKFDARDFREEGDKVNFVVTGRGRFTGRLRAPFLGLDEVPPTGKAGKNPDERITATLRSGKIARFDVEEVSSAGVPGLLARVGVDLP